MATESATVSQPSSLRLLFVAAIGAAGLTWDLWTKYIVFAQLGCPGSQPVWKGQILGVSIRFQLETTFNHGALWGMGQGLSWLFASLSFIALAAIGYFLWNRQAVASWWLTVVTGLLLAGTLGNLFDRLGLHGWKTRDGEAVYAVRDFLDFFFFGEAFHWATFNFADSYLVVGACMLVLHSFWVPAQPERAVVLHPTEASVGPPA
jgi:signal peptidase II